MSPRRSHLALTFLLALMAAGPHSGTATAATVELVAPAAEFGTHEVRFAAAPGEANAVQVALDVTYHEDEDASWVARVTDAGSPLAPGAGCAAVDAHTVTCALPYERAVLGFRLGDGDDRLTSAASLVVDGGPGDDVIDTAANADFGGEQRSTADGEDVRVPRLDGGEGDDVVAGGAAADLLVGGPGRDDVRGAAGADTLRDGDGAQPAADRYDGGAGADGLDYAGRPDAVTVDLTRTGSVHGAPGEGDEALSVVDASGGDGADRLVGDRRGNDLAGGPGDDVLLGRDGADELVPGRGANHTDGGAGRDRIDADAPDDAPERVLGGDGNDSIDLGADAADVDAGPGHDAVWGARIMGPATIRCGAGKDFYRGELTEQVTLPGVLLRSDCERYGDLPALPLRVTASAVTFRLPCLEGEFEYADYTCRGRLRLVAGSQVAGERSFTARNDQQRTLSIPRTRRLDRAIRRGTPIRIELAGFRSVESDFGKDRRGTLVWRITL